jgi:hypothetical protein
MKYGALVAAAAVIFGHAHGANACTPFEVSNFFEVGSADVGNDVRRLDQSRAMVQRMYDIGLRAEAKCSKIVVAGYLEEAEAKSDPDLDRSRAERMVSFLTREVGIPKERIEAVGAGTRPFIGVNFYDGYYRATRTYLQIPPGRWRCDPQTRSSPEHMCSRGYVACYYELSDGTVCNLENVPDPNPRRYPIRLEQSSVQYGWPN